MWDRIKIALVSDHFVPNKDNISAQQAKDVREFVQEQGIVHYFEAGRMGIEHVLLPEKGLVAPGGSDCWSGLSYLYLWSLGGFCD